MPLYQCNPAAYAGFLAFFNANSHNGLMGRNELRAAFNRMGCTPTSSELQQVIDLISVESNGISWQAFVDYVCSYNSLRDVESEYRDAFRIYDVSGTGMLSREDIKYVMGKLGIKVNIEELMNTVDTNRDGTIEYDEFVEMMKKNVL